jgi:cytochrome P450
MESRADKMSDFEALGVSVFDKDFTLNPFSYLEPLYNNREVLGFSSEGMNFLFRFDQCRSVIFNKSFIRATGGGDELRELETRYAIDYPNRARHFQLAYMHGDPDLKFKAAVGRFVAKVSERASFAEVDAVFERLAQGRDIDNYIDDVAKIPMRVFLQACELSFDDVILDRLHAGGCAFLKSLENFYDEALIRDCDEGLKVLSAYMLEQYPHIKETSPLYDLVQAGLSSGMDDDCVMSNISGNFLTAISNTVGISSAFILRTLLNDRDAWAALKRDPSLASNEHVIMELLRRDNHVKALSRQVLSDVQVDRFTIKAGQVVMLYFPGINLDPMHWPSPLAVDFSRQFNGENNIIFGGSFYTCIGRKLTMTFLSKIIAGFVRYLPDNTYIDDKEIEVDGTWMAERILTRMPIRFAK